MDGYELNMSVVGSDRALAQFIRICKTIELLGELDLSLVFKVFVDGEGSAGLEFDFHNIDVSEIGPAEWQANEVPLIAIE